MSGGSPGLPARCLFPLLLMCMPVHASDTPGAPAAFDLSIDRQPLDGALQQLAAQVGVQVIFFSRVTEGLAAPAIKGNYTLSAAMERLLAGSDLTFRVINSQTVEVRPSRMRATDEFRPQPVRSDRTAPESAGSAPDPAVEEVVVVGLAEHLVATRIATPLREIPQTVSIVTGEQMRQGNAVDLADVLRAAPGISMTKNNSLDETFYARGYEITSFHIDGGAAINPKIDSDLLFLSAPDMVEFDHVEILRGSDGLFAGNGNPGATVSLVRKRPQHNFAAEINTTAGSWDNRRVEIDITGPIARDGAVRGRMAAVYANNGFFFDVDAHERKKVFGAIEFDPSPRSTLTAGASYQWDDAPLVGNGLPFYGDGRDSRLPRDTALEFDWTRYRDRLGGVYLQYRQQLSSEWQVKLNASGWRAEVEYAVGSFNGLLDPRTNELDMPAGANFTVTPNVHTQGSADITVTGALNWFGWREEVAFGADFTRFKVRSNNIGYLRFGQPLGDPRNFDPADYPDPRLTGAPNVEVATTSSLDQYGMFASLRIYFDDAWSIVGGARLSGDRQESLFAVQLPQTHQVIAADFGTDQVVTPYAGLMYAFSRNYSLYFSYSDIYRAQAFVERSPGNRFEPVRGVNVEAGIKGEWRNGALNGSLAVFRIEQSHIAVPGVPMPNLDPRRPSCCFVGASSKSRGVDAEISGELLSGWSIGAGYTYNQNESQSSGPLSTITPKHLIKAWTNVRLPGALDRWQLGGSVHAQSETTSRTTYCYRWMLSCGPVEGVQPAYAVLDLRAGFEVDRNWQVTLSLNNALDKVYYESIDTPRMLAWYGAPRHWMLRIDGRY